ncbi:TrmB family transcriptional regulator [Haloferax gibbonsii ATCC 33959]|uniref:TrmB family transcriptional regulator n=1 Tax=Haloferax gibbonsii (strain ATCC 33959 / DSM 4427 / JCM 8863 / NBRC 102184 / NCIMB 2188 / Ma 2.38) TaxID=1227459 RepID=M0GXS9_HALGM|nr:TrmB family transcriptional regulator [Haloferax gibbonsii]ELZ76317.1 TrmB family transcriptional regulator [Haloferax gibbonsii ATCC 33959]
MTGDISENNLSTVLEEHVGLSPYETDVYLALVRGGRQSMSSVAESSGVPQQRTYDVIQTLRTRGFVKVVDGYPKEAYAVDPSEVLSPIRERIENTEAILDELHQVVDEVEGGVSTFTSNVGIKKYLKRVINSAEYSLFVLAPRGSLSLLREVLPRDTDVQTNLVLSGLSDGELSNEHRVLSEEDHSLAETIRGVASEEPFVVSADRKKGFFWTGSFTSHAVSEPMGYHITNSELALLFDRFLADSVWPLSTPIAAPDDDTQLVFPETYLRIRNCLDDLRAAARTRPLESFELEFDGYDTDTGEAVHLRGTVIDYYYSQYDTRAHIEVELPTDDGVNRTATVGGWKTTSEEYEARRLTLYGPSMDSPYQRLSDGTKRHLSECRESLPTSFGGGTFAVGFDGAIDHMKQIVAERTGPDSYKPMNDFEALREALGQADTATQSPFVEWVETAAIAGGHSVNTGGVPATLGNDVTFVGMYGQPLLHEFRERFPDQRLVSIGEPSRGDLVQFTDGKVVLSEGGVHSTLDWESLCESVPVRTLIEIFDDATHVSIGVWASFPRLPTVLDGIRTEVWPKLESPPEQVYFMSGDTTRLSDTRFPAGITSLSAFSETVPVTLFATWRQVARYARLFDEDTTNSLVRMTENVCKRLDIARFVVHTPHEAILTTPHAETTVVETPIADDSVVMKNAENYFAGGFAVAEMAGLDDGPSLVVANAVADFFTRYEREPTEAELREAIATYDSAEPGASSE